jgi:hypothetical protein
VAAFAGVLAAQLDIFEHHAVADFAPAWIV